jgi:hypothetical protein
VRWRFSSGSSSEKLSWVIREDDMLVLLAMIQAVGGAPISPPPSPIPTPEQIQAAKALFSTNPYTPLNSWGINIAAAQIGGDVLRERKLYTSERDFALDARLEKIAKAGHAEIIDGAIGCVATRYTGMSVPDLEALRTFINTPAGRSFWRVYEDVENWRGCFRIATDKYLAPRLDAEIDAVVRQLPKME